MKLSTNKLFSSSKKTKNKRPSLKPKKSNNFLSTVTNFHERLKTDIPCLPKKIQNKTKKLKLKSSKNNHIESPKINPFNEDTVKPKINRTKNHFKTISSKEQKYNFDFLKMKSKDIWINYDDVLNNTSDSDLNNIMLTSESDSNKKIQNEFDDIEALRDLFTKNEKLKYNIIIDDFGNNNLNFEQEKLIEDCLIAKEKLENNIKKTKINNVKVMNYNDNNILFMQKKNTKNNTDSKVVTFKMNNDKHIRRIKRFASHKFSMNNDKIKEFFGFKFQEEEGEKENMDINNKINEDEENSSIFENCSNKSFDSSFLDSSFAEDCGHIFNTTKRA